MRATGSTAKGSCRRYGIADRVRFMGHRSDVAEVLSAADIAVLPSLSGEAFPRAVIEAMAMGRPVVATDVGGTREAIVEGVTGFVVSPGDAEALADRIGRLAGNEAMRAAMGQAARRRAEECVQHREKRAGHGEALRGNDERCFRTGR